MGKKYVIVTGATGGLGKAFCEILARNGKNLILSATKQVKIEEFRLELLKINSSIDIVCKQCDMSNWESRKDFFDFIRQSNYQIEMLVNNAGYITEGAIGSATAESLIQAVRVNCEGTVDLTKFVVDCHKTSEKLNILTVSSFAAFQPMPYMAIYAATKSFLLSFMTALREEVKNEGIVVSTALPSGIYTTQAMKEAIASQGIGGKLASHSPEYIASYALKKAEQGKAIIIPGAFNRFTKFASNFVSYTKLAKIAGKRWRKSQVKRNLL